MTQLPPGMALVMSDIVKAFPGVCALDRAGLELRAGEVHGLVGENGAGKSTIIKILAGVYRRDGGAMTVDGEELDAVSPAAMHAHGVRVIHQELQLVDHFTVAEAVFLGQERAGPLGLDKRGMRRAAETFLREALACELDGRALVRDLGIAERKLIQIASALIDGRARLLVLDEPTAPLAAAETERLFTAIRTLNARGVTVLYVSHYLSEIVEICDRVTIFRNGRDVGTLEGLEAAHTDEIITLMIGRELSDLYPQPRHRAGATVLEVSGLGDGDRFAGIGFSVGKGEIFGIAGLIGSGREELVDAIYGLRPAARGSVRIAGAPFRPDPARAVGNGLVLVPRDRRRDGLVLEMDVAANINLASLDEVSAAGFLLEGRARMRAQRLAEALDIRPRAVGTLARLLSGGNQQKVVLGRWLAADADIFLLDEPTIGVDVGARAEIYRHVEELAARGAAVIVSSSDAGELMGLCDRIAVLVRGRLVDIVTPAEAGTDGLLALTTGAAKGRLAS